MRRVSGHYFTVVSMSMYKHDVQRIKLLQQIYGKPSLRAMLMQLIEWGLEHHEKTSTGTLAWSSPEPESSGEQDDQSADPEPARIETPEVKEEILTPPTLMNGWGRR